MRSSRLAYAAAGAAVLALAVFVLGAKIESGATTDLLTVDASSKAARVTLYDTAGSPTDALPTGAYVLPVRIRQTAATAAPATVWAMRAGASRTVYVTRIAICATTDESTAVDVSSMRYDFMRFSGANPTTGTALTPVKKRTTYAAANVQDARFLDTGLTTAGITFGAEFATVMAPRQNSSSDCMTIFDEDSGQSWDDFELAPNEGLAIRILNTAVIGDILTGYVEFDER